MKKKDIIDSITTEKIDENNIKVIFFGDVIPVSKHRELRVVVKEIKNKFPDFICLESADTINNIDFDNDKNIYEVCFKKASA